MKHVNLIGYPCGWGAKDRGCEDGPKVLREQNIEEILSHVDVTAGWSEFITSDLDLDVTVPASALPYVAEYTAILYEEAYAAVQTHHFPVFLGGDHSMAFSSWKATAAAHDIVHELGLIWIDAHMDAHTLETSPSGAYHGMPVSNLLGKSPVCSPDSMDHEETSCVTPDHLCLIGVRSYEPEEKAFLDSVGVRVIMMDEIKKIGFKAAFEEAYKIATTGTKGFGISIDLDAFDPNLAPGIGSPEPNGLDPKEVMDSLHGLAYNPDIVGLEIAEFNPHLDENNKTLEVVLELLSTFFMKV